MEKINKMIIWLKDDKYKNIIFTLIKMIKMYEKYFIIFIETFIKV